MRQTLSALLVATGALALAACGGAGSSGVASVTPPPVIPPPPPPPPPPPSPPPLPTAPTHIGLVSAAPFAVVAVGEDFTLSATQPYKSTKALDYQDVQFSYDAASESYRISLPGYQPGTLSVIYYNGTSGQTATATGSRVTAGSSSSLQPVIVSLPVPSPGDRLTYTSYGSWNSEPSVTDNLTVNRAGFFAYGIPTALGDVPTSGSATYSATIRAVAANDIFPIDGDAQLQFDFAAGKLTGWMHPQTIDDWDDVFRDYGRFDFSQTVYSQGSTTFSGTFAVPGLPNADSSFEGNFNGPNAAELMARFRTPFILNGQQGTMTGIWIGKKN